MKAYPHDGSIRYLAKIASVSQCVREKIQGRSECAISKLIEILSWQIEAEQWWWNGWCKEKTDNGEGKKNKQIQQRTNENEMIKICHEDLHEFPITLNGATLNSISISIYDCIILCMAADFTPSIVTMHSIRVSFI